MEKNLNMQLLSLGFSQDEINNYEFIWNNGGKFTPKALYSYNFAPEQAKRLAYMHKIIIGEKSISSENDMITHVTKMTGASREDAKQSVYRANLTNGYGAQNYSEQELISHLRATNGKQRRITIQDLAVSKVTSVPRLAVVGGIIEEPYAIWNSNRYKGLDAMYLVKDVTGSKVTIETSRKPQLEWGKARDIPGVLEIKGIRNNGKAVVTFDKKYCRLCNRFVIIASLRRPEFHLGEYEMVCFEGTKVYVYAINMGTKEQLRYNMGNQRIYAYGVLGTDIPNKLKKVAVAMYKQLGGMSVKYFEPNQGYEIVSKTPVDEAMNESTVTM